MEIIDTGCFDGYRRGESRALALGIGVFDGVHRGHQEILRHVITAADRLDAIPAVFTFANHPAQVLRPASCPGSIMALETRLRHISQQGIQRVYVPEFTLDLAATTPVEFVERTLIDQLRADRVVVGANFHFGARRAGNAQALEELGAGRGLQVEVVPPVSVGPEPVSSTRIRQALAAGHIGQANRMLGRAYELEGVVERGAGLGRQLSCPTANLTSTVTPLIPFGVYWAEVSIDDHPGGPWPAMMYYGRRPTVTVSNTGQALVEAHLLDWQGELYDHRLRLNVLAFARGDQRFETLQQLQQQLKTDRKQCEEFFRSRDCQVQTS